MHDISLLKGKTILVTGATGFIGRHLVRRLKTIPDVHIIIISRRSVREEHKGTTWIQCSLDQLSPATWRTAGIEYIDFVFHLGAFIPKSRDEANNTADIFKDNLVGTRFLLESLPSTPQKIIFASTVDVYAPLQDEMFISESSPLGPNGLYGASKLFCEQLTKVHAIQHKCSFSILRYGHIFGPGEEAYRKLIPYTIQRLLRGETPILFGDGSEERDLLYVSDAVDATVRAALSEVPELGPVNIVRGASRPVREIISILMRLLDYQGCISFKPAQAPNHSLRFDNRRMCELLGDWPLVTLEDGLKEEIEYMKELTS